MAEEVQDEQEHPIVAYDGALHVRAVPCSECLLSANRIVSGARAREVIKGTVMLEGSSFVCHKGSIGSEPMSVCRGWWDHFAMEDRMFRMAVQANLVSYDVGAQTDA